MLKKASLILGFMLIFVLAMSASLFAQNNCLDFDGTNDYVKTTSTMDLDGTGNDITLEAWIYIESFPSGDYDISSIIGMEDGTNGTALLRLGDPGENLAKNKLQFVLAFEVDHVITQYKLNGTMELSTNTWYHVAATFERSTLDTYIYINGIQDVHTYLGNESDFIADDNFYIGAIFPTPDRFLNGKIDEVRVWNTPRTQQQLRDNMYKELAGTETDLVAYYKLNETTGSTADDSQSSSSYDGTLYNMDNTDWVTSSAFAGPKNCLDFDGGLQAGSPDYAYKSTNVMSNTDNFTMMAWFKADVVTSGEVWRCIAYNGDDGGGYGIGISNSKVAGLFGTIAWHVTNEALSAGNWYHLSMRRSSGTVQFFLNGKLLSYSSTTAPLTPNTNFTIGNMYTSDGSTLYTDSFDGRIDEVRVYDAALTDQQIRESMCNSLVGDETNLVAYYNFDNTAGTTLQAFDGSTTNDLTLVNMSNDDWVSSAAFNTWLNTSSSSWSTTSNWSRGSMPGNSDNVGIVTYDGGTSPVVSDNLRFANHMVVDDSSMTLSYGMYIYGNLILEEDLNLNGQEILLVPEGAGGHGYLIEDGGLVCGSSGKIRSIGTLDSPASENIANLGAEITAPGANLGDTTIYRGVAAQTGSHDNTGIKRYYIIDPANNEAEDATLVFHYDDSELQDGMIESQLVLYKSTNEGETWTQIGATLNTGDNTLTATGLGGFSWWTAGDLESPLLVDLVSFTATGLEGHVLLEWETVSEIDNAGFHLWRSDTEDEEYARITDYPIPAEGGVTWGAEYEYEDFNVEPGLTYFYELEDIDYDGLSTFHGPVSAMLGDEAEAIVLIFPEDSTLIPVYPSAMFEWDGAGLERFKLGFSRSPDFTGKVIVLPRGSKRHGAWITGESYTPNRREWRKIQHLGRGGGSVYWAVFGEDEAGEGFVSKIFELKIED